VQVHGRCSRRLGPGRGAARMAQLCDCRD
jgi:hypothetical protein